MDENYIYLLLMLHAEHIKIDGSYLVEVCRHAEPHSLSSHGLSIGDPMLIRGRKQSRDRSSARYFIYILIDKLILADEEKGGVDAVSGYCCFYPSNSTHTSFKNAAGIGISDWCLPNPRNHRIVAT